MASSDVDQKYLGRVASNIFDSNPDLSDVLFQLLGLSVVLSRKLYRARKLRRLDTTRDTRSLQLYHHIIWLSKEGLAILEAYILPATQDGQEGAESQVLAAKLRASFLHVFCLFHNDPPITMAAGGAAIPSSSQDSTSSVKKTTPPKRNSRGKQPSLRDPINSVTSDASFLTNPYADLPPGSTPPMSFPSSAGGVGPPPGLSTIPHPSAFLFPSINFIPYADMYFRAASAAASALLPGAHPLRLSVAIEYAAFVWDVKHEHSTARQLARRAIRQLREGEDEGVSDEMFEDAAEMVQILGRIMKRRSFEGTPRTTHGSADSSARLPSGIFGPFGTGEISRTPPPEEYSSGRRRAQSETNNITHTPTRPVSSRYANNVASNSHTPQESPYPTYPTTKNVNVPGIEGGPVGGTSPRRRETVKHRRGQSAPSQLPYKGPYTPPKPPPKDDGYTPGSSNGRNKGKSPAVQPVSPTRRHSKSKTVGFAPTPVASGHFDNQGYSTIAADSGYEPALYATASPYQDPYTGNYSTYTTYPSYTTTGPNGIPAFDNSTERRGGYYESAATDRRGKGER
jgi:hypothetical protein